MNKQLFFLSIPFILSVVWWFSEYHPIMFQDLLCDVETWNIIPMSYSSHCKGGVRIDLLNMSINHTVKQPIYDSDIDWWDPNGKGKGFHMTNPITIRYYIEQINRYFKSNDTKGYDYGSIVVERNQSYQLNYHRTHMTDGKTFIPYDFIVVDMGCGGGLITEQLSRYNHTDPRKLFKNFYVGIDESSKYIKQAKTHAEMHNVHNVRYITRPLNETHLKSETVDIVILSDVLNRAVDKKTIIKEVYRILKPGGMLLFQTITRTIGSHFNMKKLIDRCHIRPHDYYNYKLAIKPNEMNYLLNDVGFELKNIIGITVNLRKWFFHTEINNIQLNRKCIDTFNLDPYEGYYYNLVDDFYVGCAIKSQ